MTRISVKLCAIVSAMVAGRSSADAGSGTPPPVVNCSFKQRPSTQYSWDEACLDPHADQTGCNADGLHKACRFCGQTPFPACPSCTFTLEPETPHVWDSNCGFDGVSRGCYADGVHRECRFCGEEGYDACPPGVGNSTGGSPSNTTGECSFKTEPVEPYTWDSFCGWAGQSNGCFADGSHRECKFCGFDDFDPCPEDSKQEGRKLRGSPSSPGSWHI